MQNANFARGFVVAGMTIALSWAPVASPTLSAATAVEQYRRALEIEPSDPLSYRGLARVLVRKGDRAEARRFLKHGLKVAAQPDSLLESLEAARD